jgi:hypothetical protein
MFEAAVQYLAGRDLINAVIEVIFVHRCCRGDGCGIPGMAGVRRPRGRQALWPTFP